MNMNEIEFIPPVIRILLDEDIDAVRNPAEIKRFYRPLLPELRKQARWTMTNWKYFDEQQDPHPDAFLITASGSLNPLSHKAICFHPNCRVAAADHFACTVGLYADIVTVPDTLSATLLLKERLSELQLLTFAYDVLVVKALEPLIRAGIVRFRKAYFTFCKKHHRVFDQLVEQATNKLLTNVESELKFKRRKNFITVDTGRLYDPPLLEIKEIPPQIQHELDNGRSIEEVGRELFTSTLHDMLSGILIDMSSASRVGATLFSSSRFDLLCIRSLEATVPRLSKIEAWEANRSAQLPWIQNLSARDVVRLREEAITALPRFRETILRILRTTEHSYEAAKAVAELRSEAAELTAELHALKITDEKRFRNVAGALGITISVYGFASGFVSPSVALGSLISLLALLHSSSRKDEQEMEKLKSRPSYVLLKAKEITTHSKHKAVIPGTPY